VLPRDAATDLAKRKSFFVTYLLSAVKEVDITEPLIPDPDVLGVVSPIEASAYFDGIVFSAKLAVFPVDELLYVFGKIPGT
jgi:hypothetical protein